MGPSCHTGVYGGLVWFPRSLLSKESSTSTTTTTTTTDEAQVETQQDNSNDGDALVLPLLGSAERLLQRLGYPMPSKKEEHAPVTSAHVKKTLEVLTLHQASTTEPEPSESPLDEDLVVQEHTDGEEEEEEGGGHEDEEEEEDEDHGDEEAEEEAAVSTEEKENSTGSGDAQEEPAVAKKENATQKEKPKKNEAPKPRPQDEAFQSFKPVNGIAEGMKLALSDIRFFRHRTGKTGRIPLQQRKNRALEAQRKRLQKKLSREAAVAPAAPAAHDDIDDVKKDGSEPKEAVEEAVKVSQEDGEEPDNEPLEEQEDEEDDDDTESVEDSWIRMARALNSLRMLVPIYLRFLFHPRRNDKSLVIGNRYLGVKKGKGKRVPARCWLLGDGVFEITTVKTAKAILIELQDLLEYYGVQPEDVSGESTQWDKIMDRVVIDTFAPDENSAPVSWSHLVEQIKTPKPDPKHEIDKKLGLLHDVKALEEHDRYIKSIQTVQERLQTIIHDMHPGCRVSIYGSCLSDLSLGKSSDVDLSLKTEVFDKTRADFESGSIPPEKYQSKTKNLIFDITRKLEKMSKEFRGINPVARARIPVIRGTFIKADNPYSPDGSINFDICFSNDIAVANSTLLREYTLVDPRVKQLMIAVKRWASAHAINSAKDDTISSYAWINLVIFYLQAIGLTPNLQSKELMQKANLLPDSTNAEHSINNLDTCFLTWEDAQKIWTPAAGLEDKSVAELLHGFFSFYTMSTLPSFYTISIKRGPAETIPKTVFRKRSFFFCIEDPFEAYDSHTPHNLGIPATENGQRKILHCLRDAEAHLREGLTNITNSDDASVELSMTNLYLFPPTPPGGNATEQAPGRPGRRNNPGRGGRGRGGGRGAQAGRGRGGGREQANRQRSKQERGRKGPNDKNGAVTDDGGKKNEEAPAVSEHTEAPSGERRGRRGQRGKKQGGGNVGEPHDNEDHTGDEAPATANQNQGGKGRRGGRQAQKGRGKKNDGNEVDGHKSGQEDGAESADEHAAPNANQNRRKGNKNGPRGKKGPKNQTAGDGNDPDNHGVEDDGADEAQPRNKQRNRGNNRRGGKSGAPKEDDANEGQAKDDGHISEKDTAEPETNEEAGGAPRNGQQKKGRRGRGRNKPAAASDTEGNNEGEAKPDDGHAPEQETDDEAGGGPRKGQKKKGGRGRGRNARGGAASATSDTEGNNEGDSKPNDEENNSSEAPPGGNRKPRNQRGGRGNRKNTQGNNQESDVPEAGEGPKEDSGVENADGDSRQRQGRGGGRGRGRGRGGRGRGGRGGGRRENENATSDQEGGGGGDAEEGKGPRSNNRRGPRPNKKKSDAGAQDGANSDTAQVNNSNDNAHGNQVAVAAGGDA